MVIKGRGHLGLCHVPWWRQTFNSCLQICGNGLLRPKRPKGLTNFHISNSKPRTWDSFVPDKSGEGMIPWWHWFASWSEQRGCRAGTNITWIKGDGWIKRVTLGRPTNLGRIRINILWTPDIARSSMFHLWHMLSWMLLGVFLKWSRWNWQISWGTPWPQVFEVREVGCHPEFWVVLWTMAIGW